ncbi:MAG: proline--tRNA ligase [archaeon]
MANEKNQAKNEGKDSEKVTFNIDKDKNFSDWFTDIIKTAELADIRYNVKGFLVFQPWSVLAMEAMYDLFEKELQKKGHKPYWYPSLIPESNFMLEKEHVEGFAPEVFWVTEHGNGEKFEEKLALRPTSETAFYQMFALWIRSYRDLPFKTYQRAQVWRYETKATRPFLRSREFYWIETHNAFSSLEESKNQVKEDMETTETILHEKLGVPYIFFERPAWDKFAGAVSTFGADTLTPDGRTLQLPSTHILGQNFSKPFNVLFKDKDGNEKLAYLNCYGPCISRIFAGVIATHGDASGLIFPFEIAPVQIAIIPIAAEKDPAVLKMANKLKDELFEKGYRVEIDASDRTMGEKFYYWEMKGVPLRIEIGPKELKENHIVIFRRDTKKKEVLNPADLIEHIERAKKEIINNLREKADARFKEKIKSAKDIEELKKYLEERNLVKVNFCSLEKDGEECATVIEKNMMARIRGKRADIQEKASGNCIVCGKKATVVAYAAKEY